LLVVPGAGKMPPIGRAASGKVQNEFTGRLRSVLKSTVGISQSTVGHAAAIMLLCQFSFSQSFLD
ncbi:MAG: hypothetical protein ABSE48_18480, partial [Verrucomicrobiota bacterium]